MDYDADTIELLSRSASSGQDANEEGRTRDMNPETGRRFGPYEILGRLGGGGMGHVYKAWDARLHREVAVKLLNSEYAMPGMRERFLREARAASALNHPHICTIFDIGEQDGDPYLVMELLEGETLKDRIDKRSIQVEEMICVGKEVSEALGAAHAKGVIHRDIKPANIFLVAKPLAGFQSKVLDFGLAKIEGGVLGARQSRAFDITTAGSTVGTLAYMSPEQARGEVLDSRSDLFSLGVVLYEMATRQIPFPGATSALVFVKLLNQQPEPVRDWNEAIPRDLEKVIMKLMAKERTQRFQTAHELYEALSRIGERSAGSWLRKAVTSSSANNSAAARPAEPIVRERRAQKRRPSDSDIPVSRPSDDKPTSRPSAPSDQPQFLRPIARVPLHPTPAPSSGPVPSPVPDSSLTGAGAPSGSPKITLPLPSASSPPEAPTLHVPPARPASTSNAQATPAVVALSPRQTIPEPVRMAHDMAHDTAHDKPADSKPKTSLRRSIFVLGTIVVLIVAAIAVVLIVNRGRFGPTMLTERDPLVLTEIDNQTGDKSLDGTVAEGLQIALAQSPYLLLRSGDDYRIMRGQVLSSAPGSNAAVNEQTARTIAQSLGTRAYLFGSIKGITAPYLLHVSLLNTATNDVMSSADEHALSLQEVPAALDRLADQLRATIGEDSDSISRTHNTLSREATSNVDALHAFALAEDALDGSRTLDAMRLYQQAIALEPRFTLAYLRLTVLYRKQRAERAAADAARLALATADHTSDRLRTCAQYEYEMNASGDYNRAAVLIRRLVTNNPNDADALEKLARVLRLQGNMADSLRMAQQAYAIDPLNGDAYAQAENAFIGLDRYDAAYQLQGTEQRLGLAHPGAVLTSAYLEGRQDAVASAAATFSGQSGGYKPDWSYGLYLDNTGRLLAGNALWHKNASAALQLKPLASAAAFLLAQGALDRALAGDCAAGLALARESAASPQGMAALYNSGMAAALCGDAASARAIADTLQHTYPQSFNVNSFYLADIAAAIELQANDPAAALDSLKPARQFDLISLTPFLRGRAHVALRQVQIGIVDYQTVLAHRGVTLIIGSDVYPIAQIGVARAFAETGDLNNSSDAYRHFLELWKAADPNQPLLAEARAHTR